MIVDFSSTPALGRYHLMTQTIIPRPIAWVLSVNEDESLNLAPFSFFSAVCSDPPLLALSIGKKSDGEPKDTRRNLISGRPFVVHIGSVSQADALNNTAAELAYGDSEVLANQLELADFPNSPVPRLKGCPVAYLCSLYEVHEVGPNKQAIVYVEIKQLYMAEDMVSEGGGRYVVDAEKIDPLARLGATNYATLGRHFSLARPK